MKEATITASEFKAKCLRILDDLANQGTALVITKRGRPIARVMPLPPANRSLRGTWKNTVRVRGDIVYFDVASNWECNT